MIQNRILSLYHSAAMTSKPGANEANRLFIDLMKLEGSVLCGFGMYSTVWLHDNRLYKINSRYQGAYDGFYNWMLECIKHPYNDHLPRFGECLVAGDRYCVELEPLTKCSRFFSDHELMQYAFSNPDFMNALRLAFRVFESSNRVVRRGRSTMVDRLNDLDIKPENLMYRGDTVILNDPISYWAKPGWKLAA